MSSHLDKSVRCPSSLAGCARRKPSQQRGEARVEGLLEAAVAEFSRAGYESATMSAIAERAGASIGSLYQFFPNKEAVARALRTRHMEDVQKQWSSLSTADVPEFAKAFVHAMIRFVEGHPAFLPLLDAPSTTLPVQSRLRLKKLVRSLLHSLGKGAQDADLDMAAETVLQINKAMMSVYARSSAAERERAAAEYRLVLTNYLSARFGKARGAEPRSRRGARVGVVRESR